MNTDIYNIIKERGLGLQSPTLNIITDTTSELTKALASVRRLPVIAPPLTTGVPQSFINNMTASLASATACTSQSAIHIQDNLKNVFTSITQSSMVNNLESMESCANLTNLTGSITGEIDDFLISIKHVATQQIKGIEDYLKGLINEVDLQSYLNDLIAQLEPLKKSILDIFEKETALFRDLKNKIESSSLAKSLEALWNNPCAQMLLDHTLPDDLKGLLHGQ
ncbi:hypothetical protein CTM97_00640 [Photobacterium phosphoreum]|uniref:DUF7217 domain-containing protein n=1 Tax=Photobacterium phosphoreum TaxID=659 RepID=A0A2T3JKT3_PHOPO|nr:hypothetical protein [Photobacterium phosphoreum]PSU24486.1 hypothetical protein CTM96_12640 [Photobacterium phosphoreum]PSU44406.1 hypothetical protein CTM97_00640 [Photobacterium phosphoreum]PSU49642.1 hypothetical protein C9J18_15610 [Photobacterium phosphoreum]